MMQFMYLKFMKSLDLHFGRHLSVLLLNETCFVMQLSNAVFCGPEKLNCIQNVINFPT